MATDQRTGVLEGAFRADPARSGDRASVTGADSPARHGGEFGAKPADFMESAAEKAHAVGDAVKETGVNIKDRAVNAHSAVCDFTKANPTAAVLVAFGIGAMLARLFPSR